MASNRLLPDTCAWIDFFRGTPTPLAAALERGVLQGEVLTCGVVVMELLQGVRSPREETMILNAFEALTNLEMTRDLWAAAGRLAARLRVEGHNVPFSDIVIAALALQHNCAVLTVDRHFELIPNLVIVRE
jgi:predicted nucleic acid-binding protein